MALYKVLGRMVVSFDVEIEAPDEEAAVMYLQDFGPYEFGEVSNEDIDITEVQKVERMGEVK